MRKVIYKCIRLFSLTMIIVGCNQYYKENSKNSKVNLVSLEEGKFKLNDKPFFPVTLNFLVSLQANEFGIWPTSSDSYFPYGKYQYTTKKECLQELRNEFQMVKEMGFNSVRLVGASEVKLNPENNGFLSVRGFVGNERDTIIVLNDSLTYSNYFGAMKELIDAAESAHLKVIFLSNVIEDNVQSEKHLHNFTKYFKGSSTILAFDLFNEPLYFDSKHRQKKEVFDITKKWDDIVKSADPNRLTTIGLTGIREAFEWDPNILAVDFVSFHPYEYEPEQVRNEIYWYYKNVKVPWIIGETALPADGDSVSFEKQKIFADKTLKQTKNCNGIGYSWWQYKDVNWDTFQSSYLGLLTKDGVTILSNGKVVSGTLKPTVESFRSFDQNSEKDSCLCLPNYFNYSESHGNQITGIIRDINDRPIEGAVIIAWNENWINSHHTVSDRNGNFVLKSDFLLRSWKASGAGYSVMESFISPEKDGKMSDGNLILDIGVIRLEKLNY